MDISASELFEIGRQHIERVKRDVIKKIAADTTERVKEVTDGKIAPTVTETEFGAVLSIAISPITKEGKALIANEKKTGVISKVFYELDGSRINKLLGKGE